MSHHLPFSRRYPSHHPQSKCLTCVGGFFFRHQTRAISVVHRGHDFSLHKVHVRQPLLCLVMDAWAWFKTKSITQLKNQAPTNTYFHNCSLIVLKLYHIYWGCNGTQKWQFGTYLSFEVTVQYVFGTAGGKKQAFFTIFIKQCMVYSNYVCL